MIRWVLLAAALGLVGCVDQDVEIASIEYKTYRVWTWGIEFPEGIVAHTVVHGVSADELKNVKHREREKMKNALADLRKAQ